MHTMCGYIGTSTGKIYPQIDWLQGLALTNTEDQLFRGQPHGIGLWCLLSLALECVTYIGGWVVFQHGLNKVSLFISHKTRPHVKWAENPVLCIIFLLHSLTGLNTSFDFNSFPHHYNILKIPFWVVLRIKLSFQ